MPDPNVPATRPPRERPGRHLAFHTAGQVPADDVTATVSQGGSWASVHLGGDVEIAGTVDDLVFALTEAHRLLIESEAGR